MRHSGMSHLFQASVAVIGFFSTSRYSPSVFFCYLLSLSFFFAIVSLFLFFCYLLSLSFIFCYLLSFLLASPASGFSLLSRIKGVSATLYMVMGVSAILRFLGTFSFYFSIFPLDSALFASGYFLKGVLFKKDPLFKKGSFLKRTPF